MMLGSMLIGMLLLLAIGVPVAVAIGLSAVGPLLIFSDTPPLLIVQQYFVALDSFPLVAIPLFILAGNIMQVGGIAERMLALAKAFVGHLPGGLAATCVLTCLIFSAVSGSSVATAYAIGGILIPAMVKSGYPAGFAAALQATSAELAVILPPSISLILFGISTNTSIGDLFIAGIGPGLLIAAALMLSVVLYSFLRGYKGENAREPIIPALRQGIAALMMPVIILGGIYSGIFTPTEAAVVAVAYALVISLFFYRTLKISALWSILRTTALSTAFIMFTIASAGLFSYLLEQTGGAQVIASWMRDNFDHAWTFLLAVNLLLLVVGTFAETAVSILVMAPLLTPVAVAMGIDPVHFGLIMVINLALGMITPPVAVNLFAVCSVARIKLQELIPYLLPMMAVMIVCLMIVSYVPAISVGFLGIMK